MTDTVKTLPTAVANCDYCSGDVSAVIAMHEYGDGPAGDCHRCGDCAMRIARKTLEDPCALPTRDGHNG
jgi:hypothetical protein